MLGFSFLYPAFLAGALAIAVPIILHLLKREMAQPLPFSAVRFLKRAPVEQARRKRLRELMLLALRVSALLLLALAFARPYMASGADAASGGITMLALDTSFSMSGPGQFERARDLARKAIAAAPSGHFVGVLSFSDSAEMLVEPTSNRRAAEAAIDRLTPGFGATRYRTAIIRAAEAIGQRAGHIVVVTDLQRSGWEEEDKGSLPERVVVEIADAGVPAGNLAVSGIRRDGTATVVTVLQSGAPPRRSRVTLTLNDQPVGEVTAALGDGASTDVRFPVTLPESGIAVATIEDAAGFAADNTRYLVLDPPRPAPLLVIGNTGNVSSDALYLDRALSVAAEPKRFDLAAVGAEAAGNLAGPDVQRYGAVLLLSTRRFDRKAWEVLSAYVRQGGGLLIAAGPDVDPAIVRDMFGGQPPVQLQAMGDGAGRVTFAPIDLRHPIFRPFGVFAGNLGQVTFQRTMDVLTPERTVGEPIARFSDGRTALMEYRVGTGRTLVFASDLNNRWNDFPLQPGFVPFVHETVKYLVRNRDEPVEFTVAQTPSGVPAKPGIARVGEARRRVAINVDVKESNTSRLAAGDLQLGISRLNRAAEGEALNTATQTEEQQGFWRYGLMLMLAALAVEGIVGMRVG